MSAGICWVLLGQDDGDWNFPQAEVVASLGIGPLQMPERPSTKCASFYFHHLGVNIFVHILTPLGDGIGACKCAAQSARNQ